MKEQNFTNQLELTSRLVGYASLSRYKARGNFLFKGIPLSGSHVLDVGCGKGAWAIWAALHGAKRVVGIEPEAEGCTSGALAGFRQTIESLDLNEQILASDGFLSELPPQPIPFDVVVMYNVINHLDEEAVIDLHRNPTSLERYVNLLKNLRMRMRPGGWVLIADCMRHNFWNQIGLRSPIVPTIEWHKHQNPSAWIDVFERAGFDFYDLRWSPLQPFPKLTSNRIVQYFTASHWVLRFRYT